VTPFYAVGQSTATALASIRAECGDDDDGGATLAFAPKDIRGATESGDGERLAQFILSETREQTRGRNLLWLVGDKARDALPAALKAANVGLDVLRVYETKGSLRVSSALNDLLGESMNAGNGGVIQSVQCS
jgi:uroporphyrinogen-III synthase